MQAPTPEHEPETPSTRRARSRRPFTLSEKIAIVRESLAPGVTAAHVARTHELSLNLLYYWRRVYRDIAAADLEAASGASPDEQRLADLRLQIRNLERLLGQRTLEVALLREQLDGSKR